MRTASFALRTGLREGDSHRFFASCWVMVEAPRGSPNSFTALSMASRISAVAKPRWLKKLASSATTTARLSDGAMRPYGTHVHCTRPGRPACRSRVR